MIPAHERLLDLIIALTHSRIGMTRSQIRAGVNGYAPDDGRRQTTTAFERMFERDKEMLKELGIPLVTLHGSGHYDEIGYRIDVDDYALPQVQFSPAELGAISLASQIWDGSVLSRYARRGLTKLKGVVSEAAEALNSPVIRPHEPDAALPIALQALANRHPLQFTYRAASTGEETQRTVEPWRVLAKHHGWYVWGWDRDRAAPREFRLSRMGEDVAELDEAFQGDDPQPYAPVEEPLVARVAIRPDAGAALRVQATPVGVHKGWDLMELPIVDIVAFAGEVAAYGGDVVALEPTELRSLVMAKLRGAATIGKEHRCGS